LILWGEADRLIFLEHGRLYEAKMKEARLSILKGCGHLTPLEKPDDTARYVLEFLKS
jgi:pimeloyl-ACP methyl ester carboxylesterase